MMNTSAVIAFLKEAVGYHGIRSFKWLVQTFLQSSRDKDLKEIYTKTLLFIGWSMPFMGIAFVVFNPTSVMAFDGHFIQETMGLLQQIHSIIPWLVGGVGLFAAAAFLLFITHLPALLFGPSIFKTRKIIGASLDEEAKIKKILAEISRICPWSHMRLLKTVQIVDLLDVWGRVDSFKEGRISIVRGFNNHAYWHVARPKETKPLSIIKLLTFPFHVSALINDHAFSCGFGPNRTSLLATTALWLSLTASSYYLSSCGQNNNPEKIIKINITPKAIHDHTLIFKNSSLAKAAAITILVISMIVLAQIPSPIGKNRFDHKQSFFHTKPRVEIREGEYCDVGRMDKT